MPEISGLDALRTLREHYSAAELPIIMVTAKSQSDDIVAALDIGANDYLTKPIDFPVAVARIGTQLAHKQAREALKESEERYAWRPAAPTMACGTGIFRPTLCISLLVGRPCWATKKEKSGTDLRNGSTGSMTRIETSQRGHCRPSKGIDPAFRE